MANLIEQLHPVLAAAYKRTKAEWAVRHPEGPFPVLTSTYRSNAEQARLYAQGRTTKGPVVTNAQPGQSAHNHFPSRAFDVGFVSGKKMDWSNKLFEEFAGLMKDEVGIEWGGSRKKFKDRPHFQLIGWKTM